MGQVYYNPTHGDKHKNILTNSDFSSTLEDALYGD